MAVNRRDRRGMASWRPRWKGDAIVVSPISTASVHQRVARSDNGEPGCGGAILHDTDMNRLARCLLSPDRACMRRLVLGLGALAACSSNPPAERYGYVTKLGNDTMSVENVVRR